MTSKAVVKTQSGIYYYGYPDSDVNYETGTISLSLGRLIDVYNDREANDFISTKIDEDPRNQRDPWDVITIRDAEIIWIDYD